MDEPFLILVAAFGRQMRGILGARLKIWAELPDEENKFWLKVVQNAGKYAGKAPVVRWLSVIAMRKAINSYCRQDRRSEFVAYRSEMAVKMPEDGEKDDLDLEQLADKDAVAEERLLTPDEVLEQEELAKEAHRVVTSSLGSLDAETAEAVVRNKVDGITFEVWAKRTGKSGESALKMRVSRAYQKMRKRVPPNLRRSLVHVYRSGGLEYAKKKSKKPP